MSTAVTAARSDGGYDPGTISLAVAAEDHQQLAVDFGCGLQRETYGLSASAHAGPARACCPFKLGRGLAALQFRHQPFQPPYWEDQFPL